MKIVQWAACLICGLAPAVAAAEGFYGGGSALYVDRPDYDNVESSAGGKAFFGFRFDPLPLFVEASYLDTGKADIDPDYYVLEDTSLRFRGYTLGAGLFLPLTREGSGVWLRGDYYGGVTKVQDPLGSDTESASGGGLGIGFNWKFNDWVGLRLEYQALFRVNDFGDDEDISILGAGLIFEFPTVRRPPPPRQRRTAYPQPSSYPPPARGSYEPAPPAPAASSAVSERIVVDAALKSQPRQGSATLATLPAGTVVTTDEHKDNVEGRWWFVQYERYSGWVADDAFSAD